MCENKEKSFGMIYKTLEEAKVAAKELCAAMETIVKITETKGGYELFGSGKFVMEVTE